MSQSLRHFDNERLSGLAKILAEEAARMQREAAIKQGLADRAIKEIKRRKREGEWDAHRFR